MLACVAMNDGAARLRTSGDAHPAEEGTDFGERASGDVHPAGAVAGFAFYNVGRQNKEVYAKKWKDRLETLSDDLAKIFRDADNRIHVLCISEFGAMDKNIDDELKDGARSGKLHPLRRQDGAVVRVKCDDTKSLFEMILKELELFTIAVVAHPPYVTLVDTEWWSIEEAKTEYNMCSHEKHFVQHVLLSSGAAQPAATSGSSSGARQPAVVRLFNIHMPTSMATVQRKKDCLTRAAAKCRKQDAWIMGGDVNMSTALAMLSLRSFLSLKDEEHISRSNHEQTNIAQKADWACSSGIELVHVESWVGIHSEPCFSDVHDMVAVIGEIQVKCSGASQPAVAERTSASSSSNVSNVAGASLLGGSLDNSVWRSSVAANIAEPTMEYSNPTWFPALVALEPSKRSADRDATGSASMAETATKSHVQESSDALVDIGAVQPSVAAKMDEIPVKVSGASQPAVADQTGDYRLPVVVPAPATLPSGNLDTSASQTLVATKASGSSADGALSDAVASMDNDAKGIRFGSTAEVVAMSGGAPQSVEPATESDVRGSSDASQLAASDGAGKAARVVAMPTAQEESEHRQTGHLRPSMYGNVLNDLGARAAEEDEAAEDVLASVMLANYGRRVKSDQEFRQGLDDIIARRKRYIKQLAEERGVAQPAYYEYTVIQWEQWLTERPLSEDDMRTCIRAWRDEFVDIDLKKIDQVRALQNENTRESKKQAQNIIRGAFNATLASQCGHSQLAYAFLKHPATMLDSLLSDWREYMESNEYKKHKKRCSRERDDDTATQQRKLKFKCRRLRDQWRQARRDDVSISAGKLSEDELSWSRYHLLKQYRSDELSRKLDAATKEHGFGDLRLERKALLAPSFA